MSIMSIRYSLLVPGKMFKYINVDILKECFWGSHYNYFCYPILAFDTFCKL